MQVRNIYLQSTNYFTMVIIFCQYWKPDPLLDRKKSAAGFPYETFRPSEWNLTLLETSLGV